MMLSFSSPVEIMSHSPGSATHSQSLNWWLGSLADKGRDNHSFPMLNSVIFCRKTGDSLSVAVCKKPILIPAIWN